jgi:hypothetical protein
MDIFQFSWLRYQTNSPVSGYDVMGQAAFRPSRRLDFYLRYRLRSKPRNVSGDLPDPGIKPVEERETGRLRFHLNWQYSARWRFQSRFEWVRFKRETKPSENGYLGYLDVSYSALKKPLSLHARFEVFHTDGFDTRLYAYESDVLYFYSFVPLYDKGFRTYLAARWEIGPNLDVWFKVANTAFSGKEFLGSGNAEIRGRNRTDMRVQVRVKF